MRRVRNFREHRMPFPEVRMGGWMLYQVPAERTAVNLERRTLAAPGDDTPEDQYFRDRAAAASIFTPKMGIDEAGMRHKIDPQVLDTAETMRLHFMMASKGIESISTAYPLTKTQLGSAIQTQIANTLRLSEGDPSFRNEAIRFAFLQVVESCYTRDIDFTVGELEKLIEDREIMDFLFQTVRNCHFVLDRGRLKARARGTSSLPFSYTVEVARLLQNALNTLEQVMGRHFGSQLPEYTEGGSKLWGDMTIERVPMSTPSKWRHRFSRIRRSDAGVKITALPRILTDQKIFSYKIRKKGGTVLVDCSGSMNLSPEEVYDIVCAAPAACVAVYSGNSRTGILRIVAEDGKLAHPRHICSPSAAANTIDGPALRWLATKDHPRVWVSDGAVTGIGDTSDAALHAEAQMLRRIHRIHQVPSGSEALQYFTKGGRGL